MGYLTNFIVYTLAMVGVIVIALLVFKNATTISNKGGSKYLKIHDTLSLGPRKTLYIVSAGNEKFLIAGDVDKTSLISKLNTTNNSDESVLQNSSTKNNDTLTTFKETMQGISQKSSYIDRSIIGIHSTQNKPYNSVMKNLAERIKG